jgi:hypothetical protein
MEVCLIKWKIFDAYNEFYAFEIVRPEEID